MKNGHIPGIDNSGELRRRATLGYYLALLCGFSILWIMFVFKTGIRTSCLFFDIVHTLGDMLLVLLPFWFVGKRLRVVPLVLMWLFAILHISNVLYFRFWDDVLSPVSVSMVGNLNEELTDAVGMLWYLEDIRYIAVPLIVTVLYFFLRPVNTRFSHRFKGWMIVVAVIFFASARMLDKSCAPTRINSELKGGHLNSLSKEVLQMKKGVILYSLHSIQNFKYWLWFDLKLSDKERAKITRFIESVPCSGMSDHFAGNGDRNLIIVIVESLNGSIINADVCGVEVTPVLNHLVAAPGSIYCTDVVSQIRDGVSSDGQLMIQTGLLPLRKGSASIIVGDTLTFPALPSYFPGYDCYAVFASGGHVWREGRTHARFGYDVITKKFNPELTERLGADGAMFATALKLIEADTTSRFLMTLLTASMHVPFVDAAAEPVDAWNSLPEDLRNYYTVCHYFDAQLGLFVNRLQELGLYDETVLIVTSDHSQMATSGGEYEPAFFGAFNTGMTLRIQSPVGQVNIYPTILEIMHRMPVKGYHGLGSSVIDSTLCGAVDGHGHPHGVSDAYMFDAFGISDLLIRGDYFADR